MSVNRLFDNSKHSHLQKELYLLILVYFYLILISCRNIKKYHTKTMHSIYICRNHEKYLKKCGEENQFTFGLVIGQPIHQKQDYVVHLARNIETDVGSNESAEAITPVEVKSIEEVDSQALGNQVFRATKMIPGGISVLGIFITTENNFFDNEVSVNISKEIIQDLKGYMNQNKLIYGHFDEVQRDDKLVMVYSTKTETITCKKYVFKESGGYFTPCEIKVNEKLSDWHKFESNYELEAVYPIIKEGKGVNIESNFLATIETVSKYLANSEIFIENETVDETQILENYIKTVANQKDIQNGFQAFIFLPAIPSANDPIKVEKFYGVIRFSGIISSRIWSHSKNDFRQIQSFIRTDILRSLASRIQLHCDGLNDPHALIDTPIIIEPPRRIFYEVPDANGIQFSEYIFRGEAPSVAVGQAKEILDITIDTQNIHSDLEELPADDLFTITPHGKPVSVPRILSKTEIGKSMYIIGIAIALLVVVMSIALHFIMGP